MLQRQAKIDPVPSSVMSLWLQSGSAAKGSLIVPRRTLVGKHSLKVAVSVEDFFQEYMRHASSLRHVWTWVLSVLLNSSHFLLGLRRLPQL